MHLLAYVFTLLQLTEKKMLTYMIQIHVVCANGVCVLQLFFACCYLQPSDSSHSMYQWKHYNHCAKLIFFVGIRDDKPKE